MEHRKNFKLLVAVDCCANCPERKGSGNIYYCGTTLQAMQYAIKLVEENMWQITKTCPHFVRVE
jgi:hypothetical protein